MKIDIKEVKSLYETVENVWPENDMWHQYSKRQITKFIQKQEYCQCSYLLNAGSGGSDYGLSRRMMHVDIVENKIIRFPEYTVSSVEAMPFKNDTFSDIICVGSVINYCDATTLIHELGRVLKSKGSLILEFESSWGYEHRKTTAYKQAASIVRLPYYGYSYNQWIYAPKYIRNILLVENFRVCDEFRFHFLSALSYSMNHNENKAAYYTRFDRICRTIPFINAHSNNVIYRCVKL